MEMKKYFKVFVDTCPENESIFYSVHFDTKFPELEMALKFQGILKEKYNLDSKIFSFEVISKEVLIDFKR